MHTYIRTPLRGRPIAHVAICAVGLALIGASSAHALPREGTGAGGCPVEHENGAVSYVPVGTRIGLFVCGSDGDWRFGWLVDGRTAAPPVPSIESASTQDSLPAQAQYRGRYQPRLNEAQELLVP
jgi:hypothetical protein